MVQGEGRRLEAERIALVRALRGYPASSSLEAQLHAHARRLGHGRAPADGVPAQVRARGQADGRDHGQEEVGRWHQGVFRWAQAIRRNRRSRVTLSSPLGKPSPQELPQRGRRCRHERLVTVSFRDGFVSCSVVQVPPALRPTSSGHRARQAAPRRRAPRVLPLARPLLPRRRPG